MPQGEIRVFAKCRNERLRLPAFLEHYRHLGADHFFIVDNDSTDGSAELLAGEPDVRLFRTSERFSDAGGGTDWLNARLSQFGPGSWCVTVDIDELLVYPGSESASLKTLTRYLDERGSGALGCLLLDMYPSGQLHDTRYESGGDLLAAAPLFDPGPYTTSRVDRCPGVVVRGGMRERVFYPEFRKRSVAARIYAGLSHHVSELLPSLRDLPPIRAARRGYPPNLAKVPLVRWDEKARYVYSTHLLSPTSIAQESGALLHFKFLADFHRRAIEEAARGEYFDGASEYRRYASRLERSDSITFVYPGSTRFEGTGQLVRLGLIRDSAAWADARGA
jgi:hypothetical protein